MATINAHFDGFVLVPEQPINVPAGTPLRISYEPIDTSDSVPGAAVKAGKIAGASMVDRLPLVRGLDSTIVRQTIDDPENDLCSGDADDFLLGVKVAADQIKTD